MKLKRMLARLLPVAVVVVLMAGLIGTASVAMANGGIKSLYVNADLNANSPIEAYSIQPSPTYLQYQAVSNPTRYGGVGLALDTASATLFVTFEGYNTLDIVDATTLVVGGNQVTAPGASNLAGIVVDQDKQKVYTVDRGTSNLYVYSWDSTLKTLTLDGIQILPVSALFGIALDEVNDLLYVGDLTTTVKYFNTSGWSLAGSFPVSESVMGIAVDTNNGFVYTGNAYPPYGATGLLSKYDLGSNTESTINIRGLTGGVTTDCVVGLAVDLDTGLLYITAGNMGSGGSDRIIVFNSNLSMLHATGDIGNPTGIVVPSTGISYNPLNLSKDDGLGGAGIEPGAQITYTISYDNVGNNNPVTGVVIVETLPGEVTYVSHSGNGTYLAGSPETVTWNIGTVAAGASSQSVTVTVQVKPGTARGTTITDTCSIDSDQTGQAWANEETLVNREGGEPPGPGPGIVVGGDVSPVNKAAILAPWIALITVIIVGATIAVRRRLTQS